VVHLLEHPVRSNKEM